VTSTPLAEPFDPTDFRELAAAEDRHFWFRSRNEVIVGVLQGVMGPTSAIPRGDLLSHYMAPLVPILWMRRTMAERSRRSGHNDVRELATDERRVPRGVNRVLGFVREIRHFSGGGRLPFGTSLLAVARRTAGQAPPPISSSTA